MVHFGVIFIFLKAEHIVDVFDGHLLIELLHRHFLAAEVFLVLLLQEVSVVL